MGTTYQRGARKADIIARRTRAYRGTTTEGIGVSGNCLAHAWRPERGAPGGVLWTVWEHTYDDGRPAKRFIGCDVLSCETGFGWGFKDEEESMHPYYYSCPLGYLDMVPAECEPWRAGVRAMAAQRRAAPRRGQADCPLWPSEAITV